MGWADMRGYIHCAQTGEGACPYQVAPNWLLQRGVEQHMKVSAALVLGDSTCSQHPPAGARRCLLALATVGTASAQCSIDFIVTLRNFNKVRADTCQRWES